MKLDVLIFQHSKGSPPGSTIYWLEQNKLKYKIHFWGIDDVEELSKLEYSFLIILGLQNKSASH